MSDLRRLIARMDQLNEGNPIDNRNLPPLEGGGPGLGVGGGMSGGSGGGSRFNIGTGQSGAKINPLPQAASTAPPGTIPLGGLQSKTPGTIRVGTPEVPPVAAPSTPPAVIRKRGDPKFDPILSKTDAQRQQELNDVKAKMDAAQTKLGKPRVDADYYKRQQELQQQLKDPRPAVWKDPRNPDAPASKSPPAADVAPPQPLPAPALKGKSFKDASAEVNNTSTAADSPSMLSKVGDTIKGQAMPWRGEAPPESVYGPGGIKNFRQDAPLNPEYIKYPRGATPAEKDAMFARAQSEYEKQMGWQPGFIPTTAAAAAAAAAAYGPDVVKSYVDKPGQAYMWKDQPPADNDQPPPENTNKETTKESLKNKLFKEFKTFIEKR